MNDSDFLNTLEELQRIRNLNAIYELYHRANEAQKTLVTESITLFREGRLLPSSQFSLPSARRANRVLNANSNDPNVFRDTGKSIYYFFDQILVVCGKCKGQAEIRTISKIVKSCHVLFTPRRLACGHCGATKEWSGTGVSIPVGKPVDWFFKRPLWLQTPCCDNVFWAFNGAHLLHLESYIQAKVRERATIHNKTVVSALPAWIQSSKNRSSVLKAINRLKGRLIQ